MTGINQKKQTQRRTATTEICKKCKSHNVKVVRKTKKLARMGGIALGGTAGWCTRASVAAVVRGALGLIGGGGGGSAIGAVAGATCP
ncbi:MAG: hypothetical protein OXC62_14045 [Aestuariivita sp.]|nr:hypothetical protein [Aestuariivita sp.]